MPLDPHTLIAIIRKIEQQMRCPQCGKRIPIDFGSVRLAGDDFMLLQIRCDTCDAYIVLHAALQVAGNIAQRDNREKLMNASSTLELSQEELTTLRGALEQAGGSFEKLFKGMDQTQGMRIV